LGQALNIHPHLWQVQLAAHSGGAPSACGAGKTNDGLCMCGGMCVCVLIGYRHMQPWLLCVGVCIKGVPTQSMEADVQEKHSLAERCCTHHGHAPPAWHVFSQSAAMPCTTAATLSPLMNRPSPLAMRPCRGGADCDGFTFHQIWRSSCCSWPLLLASVEAAAPK
jgi:hypothetical protein